MSRPLLWLPWECVTHVTGFGSVMCDMTHMRAVPVSDYVALGDMDHETRGHIRDVAEAVAVHSDTTADEFEESVYRLIGWTCRRGEGE